MVHQVNHGHVFLRPVGSCRFVLPKLPGPVRRWADSDVRPTGRCVAVSEMPTVDQSMLNDMFSKGEQKS